MEDVDHKKLFTLMAAAERQGEKIYERCTNEEIPKIKDKICSVWYALKRLLKKLLTKCVIAAKHSLKMKLKYAM